MSDTEPGAGWLPLEARETAEAQRARESAEEADRLLALDPRERVFALLRRMAACRSTGAAPFTPVDLGRILVSFEGSMLPTEEALAALCPESTAPPG